MPTKRKRLQAGVEDPDSIDRSVIGVFQFRRKADVRSCRNQCFDGCALHHHDARDLFVDVYLDLAYTIDIA